MECGAAARRRGSLRLVLSLAPVLAGCTAPVAGALDDAEASRVVVALDQAGIDGAKEPDPAAENKWRVEVAREDVPRALAVMREEELPRTMPAGVLDAVGKGSLVPSEAAEHAQLVAGMAGDLARTLEGIDGVLSARVHLNVPVASPCAIWPRPTAAPASCSSTGAPRRR